MTTIQTGMAVVVVSLITIAQTSLAQGISPTNVPNAQRRFVDITSISETDILAALWLDVTELDVMRGELPITDRNPIRLPRLQDEMLQEISETRQRIRQGQPVDLWLPATRVLISEYHAATNSYTLLLPGTVFASFEESGERYRFELIYPPPLSYRSGQVCCGNDYMGNVSRSTPDAAAILGSGYYRFVEWPVDTAFMAEWIYDAANENRLFAFISCELVGPYVNAPSWVVCPATRISLGIRVESGGVITTISNIFWQNDRYETSYVSFDH